jgi:hypothetical protein
VGSGTNVHLPIEDAGRLINTTDPNGGVTANKYSMGVWINEKTRLVRQLGFADLINPAGNRVSPTSASLLSAVNDGSSDESLTSFINGAFLPLWLVLSLCTLAANHHARYVRM